jgi:hypothetical protein
VAIQRIDIDFIMVGNVYVRACAGVCVVLYPGWAEIRGVIFVLMVVFDDAEMGRMPGAMDEPAVLTATAETDGGRDQR